MTTDLETFEYLKHTPESNMREWIREFSFISYGVVQEVVSISSVIVSAVVQNQQAEEMYSVPLFYPSSALFEHSVYPRRGDLVLLLFVQRYNNAMFDDPKERERVTGDMTIYDRDAVGYTPFSGIGILLGTPKNASALTIQHADDDTGSSITLTSTAKLAASFSNNFSFDVSVPPGREPVEAGFLFGEGVLYNEDHLGPTTKRYGVKSGADGETLNAPVEETYSVYAPITRTIEGTQTINIGAGGNEAAVDITLGEKADIILSSGSGKRERYEKNVTESVGGDREETVDGAAYYKSADTDIESGAPIGLNDGLYASAFKPYLDALTAACTALGAAAGSAGSVGALGAALTAFAGAVKAADDAAHTALSKVVK